MIIAAVRNDESFYKALKSKSKILFDLSPDILNVADKVDKAKKSGKKYFAHIDLATGIGRDESGVKFLKMLGVDGIVSTKSSIIKIAKELGLETVQRFFILDSQSLKTTLDGLKTTRADMIEIMPGMVFKIIERMKKERNIPIIAGGLIETKQDVENAIKSGADAVSTGAAGLWDSQ